MTNRVQYLPPDLYRKLLILDPPPKENKRVAFTDLNEVRTFRQSEPPRAISGLSETELLRERIRHLERRLERLSPQKENRQMQPLAKPYPQVLPPVPPVPATPPGTPTTACSVTGPYRPIPEAPENWSRREVETRHPPANVERALRAAPIQASRQPEAPRRAKTAPPPQPAIPSVAKRFVLGLGALCFPAAVGGLISIVGLGPIGLGIFGGCIALGFLLMAIGDKMK